MRVLLSVSLTLLASAGAASAQGTTTERRRSMTDVINEDVTGLDPVSRPVRPAANPFTAGQEDDPVERVCRPVKNPSAAVANDQARALLGSGLSRLAINTLRDAIRKGAADAETHYLLASALRKEAEEARQRAVRLAAEGKTEEAAKARADALALNDEALAELGRGRDHAHAVIDQRLAEGDIDGARKLGQALLRTDPNDARAGAAAAARPRASNPEGGGGGGGGGGSPAGGATPRQQQQQTPADQVPPVPAASETTPGGLSTTPMTATQTELEILARIVKGEAGVCSYENKVAVAAVVLNRVRSPNFPNTIRGVAHQPSQFSCYNPNKRAREYFGPIPDDAWRAAREALAGSDPSNGSTYYYNPYLVAPSWARTMQFVRRIGTTRLDTHDFYKPRS
jgi:N-acetylmuramoyl-L-alanine amidase